MINGNKPYASSITAVDLKNGNFVCSLRETVTFSGDICEFDAMDMILARLAEKFNFEPSELGVLYYCLVPNDGPKNDTEAVKVTVKEYFPG